MSVLNSRRLWTFIIAQITSGIALAIGIYVEDPATLQMVTWFIGFVQGLAGILIAMLTIDDSRLNVAQVKGDTEVQVAAIKQGSHPDYPEVLPVASGQSGKTMSAEDCQKRLDGLG